MFLFPLFCLLYCAPVMGRGWRVRWRLPVAHPVVCSHRLTVAWLVRAQKEARQTMELLKALPLDVYHELLDAVLE